MANPIPAQDPPRTAALRHLGLLDAPAEAFDRLTRLAATILRAPAAFISLVDEDRGLFLSQCGFAEPLASTRQLAGETLCHHAIRSDGPLVIGDTRADPRYRSVPMVESLGVAAYVGVPLRLRSGTVVGAFCAIDHEPRRWSEAEVQLLGDLAASALTEIELRTERGRYHDLVEGLDAIVWEMDAKTWEFTFVSQGAREMLGYPVDRWLAEPGFWQDRLVHPDDREWALRFCMGAVEEGRDHEFEYRALAADGRVVWLHDRVRVVTDDERRPRLLRGVMLDITARKETSEALRESEERFRTLFEQSAAAVLIHDDRGRIVQVNQRLCESLGYARQELVGMHVTGIEAGVGPEAMLDMWAQIRPGALRMVPGRHRRRDGSTFPVEVWIRRIEIRGEPLILAEAHDVTERTQAEARLVAAEAHYRRLVETAPQAIYALDAEGRFIELNPAGLRLAQCTAEEVMGQHFSTVIAPRSLEVATDGFNRVISGEVYSTEFEEWIRRPSGEERLLLVTETAILEDDRIVGTHGIARDITEERARQEEVELLAAALQSLEEGVSIARFDGQLVYANASHARLMGYDPDRDPLPNVEDFVADEEMAGQLREAVRTASEQGVWTGRMRRRRVDDGRLIPLELILGRVDRAPGESLLFTIARDITDELATEQHLRRAERLASVGTLIGGVAHELNNPLHAIRNFAELMLLEERAVDDREALEIIQREADRAAKVVCDLRLAARQTQEPEGERQLVDLGEVVSHVLRLRHYALQTGNIEVRQELAPNLPRVLADRSQLEQVVLNLVVNAEQSMAEQAGERRLVLRTSSAGAGVFLQVVDSGPGIPQSHLERIFDPFFTTKAPGEGTGLGLSLVHSIVTEHGGEIHVDSQVGTGTTFRLSLPCAAEAAPVAGAGERGGEAPPTSLRVLVVDDEHSIRRALSRYLNLRGHRVHVASDGEEALRLLEAAREGAGYDVIVSDLRMPGLGGDQLLAQLQLQGEGLDRRVVFLTGDAARGDSARVLADADVPVLFKPVKLEEIARVIERHAAEAREA